MTSTSRCADCWTCLTLLAPPDPASSALGIAQVVSLRGVLFSFFWSKCQVVCSYVRTNTTNSVVQPRKTTGGWEVACTPSRVWGRGFNSRSAFVLFYFHLTFFGIIFLLGTVCRDSGWSEGSLHSLRVWGRAFDSRSASMFFFWRTVFIFISFGY